MPRFAAQAQLASQSSLQTRGTDIELIAHIEVGFHIHPQAFPVGLMVGGRSSGYGDIIGQLRTSGCRLGN